MSPEVCMQQGKVASTGHYGHISDHPKHLLFLTTAAQFAVEPVPEKPALQYIRI